MTALPIPYISSREVADICILDFKMVWNDPLSVDKILRYLMPL